MTRLTILQSRILRTKKRSFDTGWLASCQILAILGLFGVLVFCLRVPTSSWSYGQISSHLPIVPLSAPGPEFEGSVISKDTPAIVLSTEAFYFGTIEGFTQDFPKSTNKYFVSHVDGEPQLSELLATMTRWYRQRAKRSGTDDGISDVVVLLPGRDVPLPIVMQVMHWIKESKMHENVVLAASLL